MEEAIKKLRAEAEEARMKSRAMPVGSIQSAALELEALTYEHAIKIVEAHVYQQC